MTASRPTPLTDIFDLLAAHWPAVAERLGRRQEAFLASAAQSAARHGLVDALSQARYLNLCFAFGPGFELKPQHEWALALLADERLQPLVKLHQVLHRARAELQRSGGDAATLVRADTRLLDDADAALQAQDRDAAPLPRQACDIEALELRVRRIHRRDLNKVWEFLKLVSLLVRLTDPTYHCRYNQDEIV